ncbi:MAG: nucleotide-binding domain containing protein [Natronomonas sp.]|uniref:nucleotide-binding domain containing protein n=1 Tax=Natronomonas sp. TaxID=2184060 RepID=UPI002870794F|nr:nucleotide-binding domain containing protein [Natronomonas sp.]MDR9430531.1 nucleotide-binding domain containing protein [Natronomonas sp.]
MLGVVGSVAAETFAQLDRLPDDAVVQVDPEAVVTDAEDAVDRAVEAIAAQIATGGPVAVMVATEPTDVSTTRQAGRNAGLTDEETAAHIESTLATVARAVHETIALDGLFLTGGAVAAATLDALDARGVGLAGRAVAAGIPLGHVEGGAVDGVPLVTKAGKFGDETAIDNSLRFLATNHDR